MNALTIWVPGHAVTQGSKRAIPLRNGRTVMVDDNPELKPWRSAVNDQARRFWEQPPMTGPVAMTLCFDIQPPKSQTRKEREAGPIKARSGDLDKLARAILDALTGVVFIDDSQVTRLVVDKQWADPDTGPGVRICVHGKEV